VRLRRADDSTTSVKRRVSSRDVNWTTRYWLEGGPDRQWRVARVLTVAGDGLVAELFATTSQEIRAHRVVLEVSIPPAVLHIRGDVLSADPGNQGGVRVRLQFVNLSVVERDLIESLLLVEDPVTA
jgi:hypothetical protein